REGIAHHESSHAGGRMHTPPPLFRDRGLQQCHLAWNVLAEFTVWNGAHSAVCGDGGEMPWRNFPIRQDLNGRLPMAFLMHKEPSRFHACRGKPGHLLVKETGQKFGNELLIFCRDI